MIPHKSKILKIGLLATEIATPGGIQSFMQRVSEAISVMAEDNQGLQGFCVSLNDNTDALRLHTAIHSNLDVWGAAGSKSRLLAYALTQLEKTEVLFVGHLGAGPIAYFMKLIGRVKKYYVILHGIESWQRLTPLKRHALLGADKIIATTRYTAEKCARLNDIPEDRFRIIPLCADERLITPSSNFNLEVGFKLLCVARQDASERYKGFEHIFEALALLSLSKPHLHLNLVGDGNDQLRLQRVAVNLGVSDRVTFLGRLSESDLAAAYQQCDVFVMPSAREGFGIVFLEAMRFGKPCIGGNHGGTPDVIEHGRSGYLVKYGRVQHLAKIISHLVDDDKLRQKMGLVGKMLVERRFSVAVFNDAYKKLISNGINESSVSQK